jgi:hypothetical protein
VWPERKKVELSESQIGAEVANAQSDMETRLNQLEQRIGRPVLSMELERLDITTAGDEKRRWIRTVRIVIPPPPGNIGRA